MDGQQPTTADDVRTQELEELYERLLDVWTEAVNDKVPKRPIPWPPIVVKRLIAELRAERKENKLLRDEWKRMSLPLREVLKDESESLREAHERLRNACEAFLKAPSFESTAFTEQEHAALAEIRAALAAEEPKP